MLLGPSDLPDNCKAHLAECSQCRTVLDELCDDLQTVENLVLATTPAPTGKFHLPVRQVKNPLSLFTGLRLFPRLTLSALALVLVIGVVLLINPGQENRIAYEASQTVDPDQLLSEIDELVETPFDLEFLLTTSTNELDADEDFMEYIVPGIEYIVPVIEYIVPLIDNDPITRTTGRKGEHLC